MSATDGPSLQEVERLNAINRGDVMDPMTGLYSPGGGGGAGGDSLGAPAGGVGPARVVGGSATGGGIGPAGSTAMRDLIAQAMMAQGGPQKTSFGGAGFNFSDPRYTSRLAAGAGGPRADPYAAYRAAMASRASQPQGDPYAAYRAAMASRASQPQGDPYAAYRAAMASRAQPAAGGGGGSDPWAEIRARMEDQARNPYDQYFALKGPMSGSGDDMNWQNALQPWQGGASGALTGTGINTSGFIGGGRQTRADPAYWGYTGSGTGWGTDQNAQMLWDQLRQNDPYTYQQLGGDAAAAAGVSAGAGPGGTGSGAGGSGAGAGVGTGTGGGGVGSAAAGRGGMSMGDALAATVAASNLGFDPDTFANRADAAFDAFSPSYAGSSVSNLGGFAAEGENPGIGDEGEGGGVGVGDW